MNEEPKRYMLPMKSARFYIADINSIVLANEGTGDNLLHEDEEEGYVDYIMTELFVIQDTTIEAEDGGQIMLTKLVADMTQEEFEQAVLDYYGIDRDKALTL